MNIDPRTMEWLREPKENTVTADKVEITTEPFTDLWQRTYYHFRNDNAPVLQMKTEEKYFSFVVKTDFDMKVRYDQTGIIMYLDSDNWLKASMEYENDSIQRLGSVATNNGYSDWASMDVDASIKTMWFRFSRREDDFCVENSFDGKEYKQMRICHMFNAALKSEKTSRPGYVQGGFIILRMFCFIHEFGNPGFQLFDLCFCFS